jgi:NAD(P)-dependent dehydrogenase (short-subunit alcohol dehydrogenase family)
MVLKDMRVAVTGGFGSLGVAVIQAAKAAGAQIAAIDQAAVPANPTELDDVALYGGVDLSSPAATKAALARIAADLGGLDAVVNTAGGFRWEKLEGGTLDTWDFLYNVNVRTATVAIQAALPYLRRHAAAGRIINIGAAGAIRAAAGMGAYAASKAAIAKLTEALAEELKDDGITVNAVLPSIIDTPRNRLDMPDADFARWVTRRQLADVIVFLLSPSAQAITGALIPVMGRV